MQLKGKVWKYGNNVDTDVIIPGRYCHITDRKELAKHCLEDLDAQFTKKISVGDILMAGKNFGCGSSRELAPIAIKEAGISCVIAANFARIFFRNSINIGLPILECPDAVEHAREGDVLEVDLEKGMVRNVTQNYVSRSVPFPPFLREIIQSGGLMATIKKKVEAGTLG